MSSNLKNKNKMYEFEKFAIIAVLVLVLTITLIVVFSVTGDSERDGTSSGNSKPVIDVTDPEEDGEESNNSSDVTSTPQNVGEKIDFQMLSVSNDKVSEGELLLVNQDHEFKTDIDEFLVNVYSKKVAANKNFVLSTTSLELRQETIDALFSMLDGFYKDTRVDLSTMMLSKAYVSVAEQQSEYDADATTADRSELPYMQAGGQSEHQTGLAFNLVVYPPSNGTMGKGTYEWFVDNCWKYGFVLRYPEGEEDRTQAFAESTHFRYVGIPHSAYIHVNQWVLEDYLDYLIERTDENNRAKIKDANGKDYEIYAIKADEGANTQIPVPSDSSDWNYSISGTNCGYYVVSVFKANND
ncbi:MAG: M15 family metallopeptidase [Clostridia bacterium]|nr:M15 family metallopeptidase [Clostridia bacterium]